MSITASIQGQAAIVADGQILGTRCEGWNRGQSRAERQADVGVHLAQHIAATSDAVIGENLINGCVICDIDAVSQQPASLAQELHIVANGGFFIACQVGSLAGLVSPYAAADDNAILGQIDPLCTKHDKLVERHDRRFAARVYHLLHPVYIDQDLSGVGWCGRDERAIRFEGQAVAGRQIHFSDGAVVGEQGIAHLATQYVQDHAAAGDDHAVAGRIQGMLRGAAAGLDLGRIGAIAGGDLYQHTLGRIGKVGYLQGLFAAVQDRAAGGAIAEVVGRRKRLAVDVVVDAIGVHVRIGQCRDFRSGQGTPVNQELIHASREEIPVLAFVNPDQKPAIAGFERPGLAVDQNAVQVQIQGRAIVGHGGVLPFARRNGGRAAVQGRSAQEGVQLAIRLDAEPGATNPAAIRLLQQYAVVRGNAHDVKPDSGAEAAAGRVLDGRYGQVIVDAVEGQPQVELSPSAVRAVDAGGVISTPAVVGEDGRAIRLFEVVGNQLVAFKYRLGRGAVADAVAGLQGGRLHVFAIYLAGAAQGVGAGADRVGDAQVNAVPQGVEGSDGGVRVQAISAQPIGIHVVIRHVVAVFRYGCIARAHHAHGIGDARGHIIDIPFPQGIRIADVVELVRCAGFDAEQPFQWRQRLAPGGQVGVRLVQCHRHPAGDARLLDDLGRRQAARVDLNGVQSPLECPAGVAPQVELLGGGWGPAGHGLGGIHLCAVHIDAGGLAVEAHGDVIPGIIRQHRAGSVAVGVGPIAKADLQLIAPDHLDEGVGLAVGGISPAAEDGVSLVVGRLRIDPGHLGEGAVAEVQEGAGGNRHVIAISIQGQRAAVHLAGDDFVPAVVADQLNGHGQLGAGFEERPIRRLVLVEAQAQGRPCAGHQLAQLAEAQGAAEDGHFVDAAPKEIGQVLMSADQQVAVAGFHGHGSAIGELAVQVQVQGCAVIRHGCVMPLVLGDALQAGQAAAAQGRVQGAIRIQSQPGASGAAPVGLLQNGLDR